MTAFYIFNYLYRFATEISKNDFGGLDKITVVPVQGNLWPQNYTPHVKMVKIKSHKVCKACCF